MFITIVRAGAVGAGAVSHFGSGSDQIMRLLVVPAPQHCHQGTGDILFDFIGTHCLQTFYVPVRITTRKSVVTVKTCASSH
jgi:hypothetical protein